MKPQTRHSLGCTLLLAVESSTAGAKILEIRFAVPHFESPLADTDADEAVAEAEAEEAAEALGAIEEGATTGAAGAVVVPADED